MQYRCPKCQSPKILPLAQANGPAVRPVVPKSLVVLIPAVFVLLLLVLISIAMWIFADGAGTTLQAATVVVFLLCIIAGFFFTAIFPILKFPCKALCSRKKNGNAVNAITNGKFKTIDKVAHQHASLGLVLM